MHAIRNAYDPCILTRPPTQIVQPFWRWNNLLQPAASINNHPKTYQIRLFEASPEASRVKVRWEAGGIQLNGGGSEPE